MNAWGSQSTSAFGDIKERTRACQIGIIGAADAGDVDALLAIGSTSALFLHKVLVEPTVTAVLMSDACRGITTHVLWAAARNRSNATVMRSLEDVLHGLPPQPSIEKQTASELREMLSLMSTLKDVPLEELDQWLGDHYIEEPIGLERLFTSVMSDFAKFIKISPSGDDWGWRVTY